MNFLTEQPCLPFAEVQWDWDPGFHDLMLNDRLRMQCYEAAIKEVVKEGDVVVDIGTGTGILSLWALKANASKVYGIEVDSKILSIAQDRINKAGYADKFVPINQITFDATLPEKVDVVISEIIGNLGDNEGFQLILEDVYKRFSKTNCRSIPQRVETFLVPVAAQNAHEKLLNGNIETLNEHYNISRLLKEKNLKSAFNLYYDTIIPKDTYLSSPKLAKQYYDRWQQPSTYRKQLDFIVDKKGSLTGFKGYFVAQLSDNIILDISGDDLEKATASDSWKHAYLPIEQPIDVEPGDQISLQFRRSHPEARVPFEQVYCWRGKVNRGNKVVGYFDQSLDEELLKQPQEI